MRIAVIGYQNRSSAMLVEAWRDRGLEADLLEPAQALAGLRPGDVALNRLDLLPTLDGVEPGLDEVRALELRGVRVLNRADALLGAHDKLLTARLLDAAGVAHPRVVHVEGVRTPPWDGPCVVKPRYGSWGRGVYRCESEGELTSCLEAVSGTPWFRRHGALVQELIRSHGTDLRLLVAGRSVAGAATRVAAPGEWRTNVTLGGSLVPTVASRAAGELGVRAAAAIGADFVGVDLLPLDDGAGFTVLELNGAVDFNTVYAPPGRDIYAEIAAGLGLSVRASHVTNVVREAAAAP